ncbi:tetratricopeptide repeat protein [Nonomuraea guangzhouensis]|uniref:Tetratricopeptide repeat protein n=1 Tax=Nonomuraea guangzhouensis TaxID=1291555 RepID=A0ABW4GRS3_9ACTN|nr:tetratricopeptide repeat protein [Nonomuraea guangzhouensis]
MDGDQLVAAWLARLDRVPPGDPDRPDLLSRSAGEFLDRCGPGGSSAHLLDLARAWLEEAVAAVPSESLEHGFHLSNLGVVHQERHSVTCDQAALDQAVECFASAADQAPAQDPDLPMYLNNLANALTGRALAADIARAVDAAARGVTLTPWDSPDLPLYANTLGNALFQRYEAEGACADLDVAVDAYRAAAGQGRGTDVHAMSLGNLGSALCAQAALSGRSALMDRAVRACESAVRAAPATSADREPRLTGLADVLRESHVLGGAPAPLERAISIYRTVLARAAPGELPGYWNNLGNCLRDRFAASGSRADLDGAIALSRQALDAEPGKLLYLGNLASGLRARYLLLGDETDMREALDVYRKAASSPGPAVLRARWLNNLGNGFHERYVRAGDLDDLHEAIRGYRRVGELAPEGSVGRSRVRGNLGTAPAELHNVNGQARELDEAVSPFREAVAASPQRALDLDNLGTALVTSFCGKGDRALLAEAARLHEEAAPYAQAEATGSYQDMRAALTVLRRTAERAEPTNPHIARYVGNLASVYRQSHALFADEADLREGVRFYRQSCSTRTAAPIVVLRAAQDWAAWAGSRAAWPEAAEASAAGLLAMEGLVAIQAARAEKEAWLREARELPGITAFACAETGALQQAVTAAERGRAVLLSETIEREKPRLEHLHETGHGRLADRQRDAGRPRR